VDLSGSWIDRLGLVPTDALVTLPGSESREGHADFLVHLAGRVAHVAMVNVGRGAKLRAVFERIQWDRG
jgi:RNA-directed DNA polymerase